MKKKLYYSIKTKRKLEQEKEQEITLLVMPRDGFIVFLTLAFTVGMIFFAIMETSYEAGDIKRACENLSKLEGKIIINEEECKDCPLFLEICVETLGECVDDLENKGIDSCRQSLEACTINIVKCSYDLEKCRVLLE